MANATAATRALNVLRLMAKSGAPVTASSLATKLDLPRSSMYHLLAALEADGYVIHYPEDSRWGLGIATFELGQAYLRHDPLERLARPILAKLVHEVERKLPAIGHLAILHGDETLYLLRELPRRPIGTVTEVGVRLPAHLTASGRAMLAQLPAKQVRAFYGGKSADQDSQTPLLNRTGLGPATIGALMSQLAQDKAAGYASEDGHITAGLSGISVAVLDHLDFPVAALNLTFQTDAASAELRDRLTQALQLGAASLSKNLGRHSRS